MAAELTRRQMMRQAGYAAAGLGGLGLAGWSADAAAAAAMTAAKAAQPPGKVRHFVSRPDLSPPRVSVTGALPAGDPRYILLGTVASGPGQGGAMILRANGDLVWFGPDYDQQSKMDIKVQAYRGQPVLTWYQGPVINGHGDGVAVIADSSYRVIRTIRAAQGLQADLHEFTLTPQGTALITAYRPVTTDLSAVGGPARGTVFSGVVQEIDVATGKLLFSWESLDHIPVTESHQAFSGGTAKDPYDYFHINSIAVAPDGDLIISARNTWAVYKISRPGGQIAWRLGGRKSSFTMGPGTEFYWQHHACPHGASVLTLFDDGAAPAQEKQSRGLVLHLDLTGMRASLQRAFTHPGRTLLAAAMGSAQLMPDGGMLVGWGTEPYFSRFSADGRLLLDGAITAGDPSYRAFLSNWTGRPDGRPSVAARAHGRAVTVYASWNGATEIRRWTVLAGRSPGRLADAGSARRTGFETSLRVPGAGPYFAVEARDRAGRVLGRSAPVRAR